MSKGDNTRQMIVEKAADLFNRFGYDGCSLADIMEATSLGMPYPEDFLQSVQA